MERHVQTASWSAANRAAFVNNKTFSDEVPLNERNLNHITRRIAERPPIAERSVASHKFDFCNFAVLICNETFRYQ